MIEAGRTTGQPPAAEATQHTTPIAYVDLDRYCSRCSYNLRTLPVERDGRTGIPMVRCPECGTFHPANELASALRPWVHRFGAIALGGWILLLLFVFFWLGMGRGGYDLRHAGGADNSQRHPADHAHQQPDHLHLLERVRPTEGEGAGNGG